MTIQDMVYNFKLKADKLDSKGFANLKLPAIIYLLNEGMTSLIKKRYSGANTTLKASFEEIQKRRDEFQRILVPDEIIKAKKVLPETYVVDITQTAKPYMFLARANFYGKKDDCKDRKLRGILAQTDDLDLMEDSPLEGSSFEWGEVLYRMAEDKLRVTTDQTFSITKGRIDYLRYPTKVDMSGYTHFNGSASSDVDCELPEFMHYDIVDEAKLVYDISFATPDAQAILLKLANNE